MASSRLIGVDFDGVIHDAAHPLPGRKMGPPMPGAVEAMTRLAEGDVVVVFTVRGDERGRPHVEAWLDFWKVPYARVTNIKEPFDIIVDDRAVHFTSWEDIECLTST